MSELEICSLEYLRDLSLLAEDDPACKYCEWAVEEIERLQRVVQAARAANIWLFTGRDETGRAEVACQLNAALIVLDESSELSAAEESKELEEHLREG